MKKEPCSWHNCLFVSDDALLDVTLIFGGRTITKRRIPLCGPHMSESARTGRVLMKPEMLLEPERR